MKFESQILVLQQFIGYTFIGFAKPLFRCQSIILQRFTCKGMHVLSTKQQKEDGCRTGMGTESSIFISPKTNYSIPQNFTFALCQTDMQQDNMEPIMLQDNLDSKHVFC